jgi:Bacterial regulatory helix-turn-helix protein, lysR family
VTVAEEGQFQLAADHPATSQQAVSKRLATLEADLGVCLLNRSAGGTRLTIDGQAFLPHAAVDGVRGSHVGQCGDRVRRGWTTYIAERVSTPAPGNTARPE